MNIRHVGTSVRAIASCMVSALVPGSSGLGSSPGRGHCVMFLVKTLLQCLSLSTQVYKWIPAKLVLEGNPAMD